MSAKLGVQNRRGGPKKVMYAMPSWRHSRRCPSVPRTSAKAICIALSASRTSCGTFLFATMAWMPPPDGLSLAEFAKTWGVSPRIFSAHLKPPFLRKLKADW